MAKRSVSLLLLSVGFLLGVGIIMLISTCAFSETSPADDIYKDAKRQVVWILAGVVVCGTAACVDYRWLQKRVWWIVGFVTLLLALCYVPGVGQKINGEYRWINAAAIGLRGLQVQPSELAKITIAVFLAYWFALHTDSGKHPLRGFLIPVSIT
ncbi:MAG: FtsW/RodA/SpoVE family cell cycle protein, partial [Verrucomicrobiae bacterium]|nr:FtsW/RodA/SpoVE family cell cycle protein [Verrucomicrobiae bacterium]